jgi:glycerol-3-phosphate acyltransferase PlsY
LLSAILYIIATFVVAGIPTGFWLVKAVKGVDIRDYGSKSTGATNVWRCFGRTLGLTVFFIDTLKGLVPTALAVYLSHTLLATEWSFAPDAVPALVAVFALVGHSKSVFLNFQGGKSAATGLGTLLGLCPIGGVLTFCTWLLLVLTIGYVSLASILGVFMCGVYFWLFDAPVPYIIFCIFGFIYVTYRHKANIKRMLKGEEPKLGEKAKDAPPQTSEQTVSAKREETK